jgi:hypothetical protein
LNLLYPLLHAISDRASGAIPPLSSMPIRNALV